MNKEIKFRAWDVVNDVMAYMSQKGIVAEDGVEYTIGGFWFTIRNRVYSLWEVLHDTDFHVMQFTGIKDRDTKEIYQSDLVKVANNQVYEVVWLEELEYEEKCAGWGLKQVKGEILPFLFDSYAIDHCEIIGNIHDNADLI